MCNYIYLTFFYLIVFIILNGFLGYFLKKLLKQLVFRKKFLNFSFLSLRKNFCYFFIFYFFFSSKENISFFKEVIILDFLLIFRNYRKAFFLPALRTALVILVDKEMFYRKKK